MSSLHNDVYDNGLNVLTNYGTVIYICSAEPTTAAEAMTTYALGVKTGVTIASPTTRTLGGREVIVPAVTDGTVTATGTATHYAIVDPNTAGGGANPRLLAAQILNASQAVTSGNIFTLTSATIGIPKPYQQS